MKPLPHHGHTELHDLHAIGLIVNPAFDDVIGRMKKAIKDCEAAGLCSPNTIGYVTSRMCDALASTIGSTPGEPESKRILLEAAIKRVRTGVKEWKRP